MQTSLVSYHPLIYGYAGNEYRVMIAIFLTSGDAYEQTSLFFYKIEEMDRKTQL